MSPRCCASFFGGDFTHCLFSSQYPYLTAELIRRGYSDDDVRFMFDKLLWLSSRWQIAAVLGGNVLRAMRAMEAVRNHSELSQWFVSCLQTAVRLQQTMRPLESVIFPNVACRSTN